VRSRWAANEKRLLMPGESCGEHDFILSILAIVNYQWTVEQIVEMPIDLLQEMVARHNGLLDAKRT